jgi:hypothetical protein
MVISMRKKTKGSWVQTSAIGLGRQKNWGQGTKAGTVNNPNHRWDWVGHNLTFGFGRGSGVVIWNYSFWVESVVGDSFSPLSQRCHRSFLSFLDSKLTTGENGSEQMTIDKMERCYVFLFLVTLWAQVGSQWLLIKAAQVPGEPGN